jgi:hypothetical protein
VLWGARRCPLACAGFGRAVKAGRQAARRGSVDGPVITGFENVVPSRSRLGGGVIEDALRCRLQFPTRVWGASRPGSVAWTCLRRSPTESGPSMERCGAASSAQSHMDDREGHADTRAGLLAASERHPVSVDARQRISPSRRP